MRRDDLSGGDFERRKQRCRAMPLVVVALAGQGAAIGLQIALRSLQSLDRRLFVHAQHNGLRRRGDVKANNIGGFGRKVRVVALTPGLASREVNLVAAQEPPDILDVNIAQRSRQRLTIRGWTPTSLAIERVLRPAAASRTIRARFKSRCNVTGERQHASSTLRSFLERWTSLASGIIHILNHDSRSKKSGY